MDKKMETFILNNGVAIPAVGLGTYPMNGRELISTVFNATRYGFRMFDTSQAYSNEKALGYAIMICGKRKDLFITTKLSNTQQRQGDVRKGLTDSLKLIGVKYIDLYLMHWPNPDTYLDSWKQMEILYKEGLCRAIGVCNFHQHHMDKLLSVADVIPAVNQVELHPLLSQKPLIKYCASKGILIEAYSPLARMHKDLIENPTLVTLSAKYNKSITQIILRWDFQNNIISIPKTSKKERLKENIDIFDFNISQEDIDAIDSINKNFRVRYDPDDCDFSQL